MDSTISTAKPPQLNNNLAPTPNAAAAISIEMSKLTNNPSPTSDSTAEITATPNPTISSPVQESAAVLQLSVAGATDHHHHVDPSAPVVHQIYARTASSLLQESAVLLLTVFSVAGSFAALYHQTCPNVRPWLLCSVVGFVVFAKLWLVGKYLRRKLPAVAYLATFLMIAGAGLAITFLFLSLALVLR